MSAHGEDSRGELEGPLEQGDVDRDEFLETLARDAAWPLEDVVSLVTKCAKELLRQERLEKMHETLPAIHSVSSVSDACCHARPLAAPADGREPARPQTSPLTSERAAHASD